MATTAKPVEKSPEKKPESVETIPQPSNDKPEHLGAHPDSFYPANFERGFKPTADENLDEPGRWIRNEFFNATGPTTVVRLDELANLGDTSYEGRGDTSDRQLAREIMMRAGLGDHPRFNQLCDMMAVGLGEINDPKDWLHGYSKDTSERPGTNSGSTASTSG